MILTYKDQQINQRDQDGYVNLTQMAKANGVLIGHWSQLEATKSYLKALESDIGIATSQLLIIKKGNSQDFEQGTWAHPLLALNFGRWISPAFAIWCDRHIKTLLETGSVSLISQEKQPQMQLTTQLIALETARIVDEIYRLLSKTQPRTAQVLIDSAISGIMPTQNLLETERLKGVVELAEEMGLCSNRFI